MASEGGECEVSALGSDEGMARLNTTDSVENMQVRWFLCVFLLGFDLYSCISMYF